MPQSKEVHKEYMRNRRKGSQQEGSQSIGSQEGSHKLVFEDDGSILDIDLLLKHKEKLNRIIACMPEANLSGVRFGLFGCTLDRVKQAMEVI